MCRWVVRVVLGLLALAGGLVVLVGALLWTVLEAPLQR